MTSTSNVEMVRFPRRSVVSSGRGWSLRMGIVAASLLVWANVGQAQFTVGVGPVVGGYGWG